MLNTQDHVKVFQEGVLNKNYTRVENVFGFTPCDYVINKLLYCYNTIINGESTELTNEELIMLTKLRSSLYNIDRTMKIIPIVKKSCENTEIEDLLKMI